MFQRFDTALMQPPTPHDRVDDALLERLRAWCVQGTRRQPTTPIRIASIAPIAGLDAAACALDGSHVLARLGRWQGLAWRLQIVLRESRPGHRPRPTDPWDCGWWREGALAAAAAFKPRRATLLLVREPRPSACEALLATLRDRSPAYARPLRVLVVSAHSGDDLPRI